MEDVPAQVALEVGERGCIDLLVHGLEEVGCSYVDGGEVAMQGREVVIPLIGGCEGLHLRERFHVVNIGGIAQLYTWG